MHRTRAAMAVAAGQKIRVALLEAEYIDRQPQQVGRDLRIGGLVSLTVGLGADRQRHGAVGLERGPRHLQRHAAGRLEEAGNAEAAQQAGFARLLAPLAKAVAIGERDRVVQIGLEAAAVDLHAHRRAMRKPADDVAAAQLDGIDAGPDRSEVHQPLDQIIGFGLAGAAIGVDRRRVGEGAAHLVEHRGDVIDAADRAAGRIGGADRAAGRQIRAHIGDRLALRARETGRHCRARAARGKRNRGHARS